eukprot:RCo053565
MQMHKVASPYTSHGQRKVFYSEPEVSSVEEMLEPLRPLVKSDKALTHPIAPTFLSPEVQSRRQDERHLRRVKAMQQSAQVGASVLAERKLIKAYNEFDRERKYAERVVYRISKEEEFRKLHNRSPFLENLLATTERSTALAQARDA